MEGFFKSTQFKVLAALAIMCGAFLFRAIYTGGFSPLVAQLAGAITTPIQSVSADISASVGEFFGQLINARKIALENEALKEKLREQNQQLIELETYKQQNEQYRAFLGLKEENPDFDFEAASVIGRDHNDRFGSFVIDKGSYHGVKPRDPVISADGLVGIVSEVGLTQAKVITILDVALNVGAVDIRTRDTGIVTGSVELAFDGLCRMNYLLRESGAAVGDLVVTSGSDSGGLFPKGLVIGNVVEVLPESSGLSLYATIRPAADIAGVKDVFVIKSFLGQGESFGK